MITIAVNASTAYEVKIGTGLLCRIADEVKIVTKAKKLCIVSDDTVWPLYGDSVNARLTEAGYCCIHYVFPTGEASKNSETYLQLLNYLAENHITRSDALIALGGGVAGDLTGFAAATYLRGVDYIQVPTTLLAMVDSSVGGKTAIDLPAGKNLVGAFYQPKLVLCDMNTLNTLPEDIFRDGCAEVIKYGVLYDRKLFDRLAEKGMSFDQESVIARCVELKRNVVAEDEFDRGARQKLNLGHTIGHGVEAHSNFSISHGKGVAIGMAIVSRAAVHHGICEQDTCEKILTILDRFGLPKHTDFTWQQLYTAALSDKKRSGGNVNLILPQAIGNCVIRTTPVSEIPSFIQAGL